MHVPLGALVVSRAVDAADGLSRPSRCLVGARSPTVSWAMWVAPTRGNPRSKLSSSVATEDEPVVARVGAVSLQGGVCSAAWCANAAVSPSQQQRRVVRPFLQGGLGDAQPLPSGNSLTLRRAGLGRRLAVGRREIAAVSPARKHGPQQSGSQTAYRSERQTRPRLLTGCQYQLVDGVLVTSGWLGPMPTTAYRRHRTQVLARSVNVAIPTSRPSGPARPPFTEPVLGWLRTRPGSYQYSRSNSKFRSLRRDRQDRRFPRTCRYAPAMIWCDPYRS